MVGAVAIAHMAGRAVKNATDTLQRYFECIGSNLRKGGFKPLPDRRRPDEHREVALRLKHDACALLGPGRPALDEAAHGYAVVAAVDQAPLEPRARVPVDLREAAIEGCMVVAAVEFVLALKWGNGGDLIGHLGFCHQIASAQFDAIDAKVGRDDIEQAFAEKIGFEPPGTA